jgi:hypothetical protein
MLVAVSILALAPSVVVPVTPATGFEAAREPQIAMAAGKVYVAFGMDQDIYETSSTDGGLTYATPSRVGSPGRLALGMRRGPRIALSGTTLVVTAIGGPLGGGKDGDILAWRSTDDGKTWNGPSTVNDVPASAREGLHAMAASPKGQIACTWLDLRAKGTTIYLATSDDAGKTWSKNRLVYESPDGTVCQCCHPSIAYASDGALAVMWRNALGGNRDMYVATSKDRGATFGQAQKLGSGAWAINACPMDGGNLAFLKDGTIASAWRRDKTVYTCSAGKPETSLGAGEQPWIAAGLDGVYTVWIERRRGKVFASLPGKGTEPQVLAETGENPVVASSPTGQVIAAWTSPKQGIYSIVLRP